MINFVASGSYKSVAPGGRCQNVKGSAANHCYMVPKLIVPIFRMPVTNYMPLYTYIGNLMIL